MEFAVAYFAVCEGCGRLTPHREGVADHLSSSTDPSGSIDALKKLLTPGEHEFNHGIFAAIEIVSHSSKRRASEIRMEAPSVF